MRILTALLAVATLVITATAQVDMNKIMAQQGMQVEENNDPFVPNTFIGSYRMEMHMFKKETEEKNSPMNIHYAFIEDMTAMNVENTQEKTPPMRMIYDLKNKFQYTLIQDDKGQKTGMKQKMKKISVATEEKKDGGDMEITRTDQIEEIGGYQCRRFIGKGNDAHGEWWVAEEVDIDLAQAMSMVEMRGRASGDHERFAGKGLPMQMTWEKNDGSEKIMIHTKDVVIGEAEPGFFDMEGYEMMDMTTMPGMPR